MRDPSDLSSRYRQRRILRRYLKRYGWLADKQESNPYAARHFAQSVGYALEGLWFAFRQERNLRIHLILQIGLMLGAFYGGVPFLRWVMLLQVGVMILFAELANTILEWLVDLLTEGRFDIRAKRIKDMAAGTCLVVSTVGYGVMGCVLWLGSAG